MASITLAGQTLCFKLAIILFLSVAVSGLWIPEFVTLGRSALQNLQRSPGLLRRSPRGPIVKPTVDGDPYAYVPTTTGTAAAAASTSNVIKNPPPASSTATSEAPGASGGLKADSTVKDIGGIWPGSSCDALNGIFFSKELWDQTQATQQFQKWEEDNRNDHDATNNFATKFAQPIKGDFVCGIPQPCEKPDPCGTLKEADKPGTAWEYEVIVSLSNISKYLNALWSGINLGKAEFTGLQNTVQQTFYPALNDNPLATKEALAAIGTALIIVGVMAGGPTAGVITIGLSGAISGGITAIPSQDQTFAHLAEDEKAANDFTLNIQNMIVDTNTEIFSSGPYSRNSSIQLPKMLAHGAWSDYRNVPVLNSDKSLPMVTAKDLRDYYYALVLAGVVNSAWKKQTTYIMCFPMTKDEFDSTKVSAGNNDGRLKLFYKDSGCYLQSIAKTTSAGADIWKSANPSGWGKMNGNDFPFTPADVIKGSFDADAAGGYGYTNQFHSPLDIVGLDQPGSPGNRVFDWPGVWDIPICRLTPEVEQQTTVKKFASYLNGPGVSKDGDFSICKCLDRRDQNGNGIASAIDLKAFGTDGMGLCGPGVSVGDGPFFYSDPGPVPTARAMA